MNVEIARRLLTAIAARLPDPRVIYDREGGTPYLSRWYLIGKRYDPDPKLDGQARDAFHDQRASEGTRFINLPFNLFLHRFHRSDDDGALHNHPWAWSVALILAGGYSEERREADGVVRREFRPLAINFIRGSDYHRVDLFEQDAWSLFLVGPKVSSWYFWDRDRKARSNWRDFIAHKRGLADDARWESDTAEVQRG